MNVRLRRSQVEPTGDSPPAAAFPSTLLLALGQDKTRESLTVVHVRRGVAYACDGHRMHIGPTSNADGVYSVEGSAPTRVTVPFYESMTQLKCDAQGEVELSPDYVLAIRSWRNSMLSGMDLHVAVNAGIEHAMVELKVPQAAQTRAKREGLDRDKYRRLYAGNPAPEYPAEGEARKVMVFVDAGYLLDAVAHAGRRVRFAGELDPVEFLSEHGHAERAFVMPVRP